MQRAVNGHREEISPLLSSPLTVHLGRPPARRTAMNGATDRAWTSPTQLAGLSPPRSPSPGATDSEMALSAVNGPTDQGGKREFFVPLFFDRYESQSVNKNELNTMTDTNTNRSTSFHPSITTDDRRPALLLAGVQVMIALISAVLITQGVGL